MEGGFDPDCRRCMPWEEISTEEKQEKIRLMKKLIRMRRTEEACRSPHFHFPDHYEGSRCVEYIKLDSENRELEIILNCSDEPVTVGDGGESLFSINYDAGILGKNGTLIRKRM